MKRMKFSSAGRCLLFLCSLWCAMWSGMARAAPDFPYAQIKFDTVGGTDSYTGGSITALVQDVRGFIWIGTQQGLLRYDGYRFRRFIYSVNDPHSISGDYVYALHAAQDGRILVGTNSDGLSIFDPASEHFQRFTHDVQRADSLSSGRISAVLEDAGV